MIPYEQWNNNLRHFFSHKLSEEELTNVSQLNLELCWGYNYRECFLLLESYCFSSQVSFRVQYPQDYHDLSHEDRKEFKQTRYGNDQLYGIAFVYHPLVIDRSSYIALKIFVCYSVYGSTQKGYF